MIYQKGEPAMLKIGDRVRIADDWHGAGQEGRIVGRHTRTVRSLGHGVFVEQWWCLVLWDGDDDPEFHKSAGLVLIESKRPDNSEAKSLGEEIIDGLREGLEDLRAGRVHDHEDVFEELDAEFADNEEEEEERS
jgi:hypothetical protein